MDACISGVIQTSAWTSSEHEGEWKNSDLSANVMNSVKLIIVNTDKQFLSSG